MSSWFVFDLFSLVWVAGLVNFVFGVARRREKAYETGEVPLNLILRDEHSLMLNRIFGTIFVLLLLATGGWLVIPFMAALTGAFYFLSDFRPRTKSWVRKLAEAAMRKLKQIKLPSPVPSPKPAGV